MQKCEGERVTVGDLTETFTVGSGGYTDWEAEESESEE